MGLPLKPGFCQDREFSLHWNAAAQTWPLELFLTVISSPATLTASLKSGKHVLWLSNCKLVVDFQPRVCPGLCNPDTQQQTVCSTALLGATSPVHFTGWKPCMNQHTSLIVCSSTYSAYGHEARAAMVCWGFQHHAPIQ